IFEVSEGRVLLTGFVDHSEDILKILKVVWEQDGVKEVINEIKVKNKENDPNVFDYAKDSWTTSQIKTKLIFASGIRSANYSIETINSVVYIFGIAADEAELEKVKEIASNASSVKKVMSYARVRKMLDSRLEDTKGNKPVSNQEQIDIESLEGQVSEDDIFDTENFE
ncbi:MAG: BON domain-containing protein, partial [Alphaproteobacteria bacterium]|nr:BON domain-containing protein [Alphaproteobacteria bacterium]